MSTDAEKLCSGCGWPEAAHNESARRNASRQGLPIPCEHPYQLHDALGSSAMLERLIAPHVETARARMDSEARTLLGAAERQYRPAASIELVVREHLGERHYDHRYEITWADGRAEIRDVRRPMVDADEQAQCALGVEPMTMTIELRVELKR